MHLVGVGRADAAAGGADGVALGAGFASAILGLVVGHDHVRLVADAEVVGGDGEALGDELVDLGEEGFGVEDDAVADEVHDARAEDADGEQVGGVLLAVDANGVAGVGAAAVADDDLGLLGEEINDLALAFIAPLEAENARISVKERVHA